MLISKLSDGVIPISQQREEKGNMHYSWEEEIIFKSGRRIVVRFRTRAIQDGCIQYRDSGNVIVMIPLRRIEYMNSLTPTCRWGEEPYGLVEDTMISKQTETISKQTETRSGLGNVE